MSIHQHIYDPLIRQQIQLTLDAIYACNIIKDLSASDRHLETYRLLFSKLNNSNNSNNSDNSNNLSLITIKIQELTRALANIDQVLDECDEILNI